jgi:peroxiredoxin
MKKYIIVISMVIVSLSANSQDADTTTLTKIGQTVPSFTVTTIDGKVMDMFSLRGKVVLINFFATWCGPCMNELPKVEKDIWQQLKGANFLILAIGREHTKEDLVKFNKGKEYTFLIAPDPTRAVYSLFAKAYIPRNYVIGKNGRILFQSIGYSPDEFGRMSECIKAELE